MEIEGQEVLVTPDAILEINRGPHITVAQAHGIDWTAAPAVQLHPLTLSAMPDALIQPVAPPPKPEPPDRKPFYIFAIFLAALAAYWILKG